MSQAVARMTMLEFAEAMAQGVWLLLPVGTTEEHGPHLPLGSDMLQAEYVASTVASAVGGVVAPGLAYGVCRTTRNFPGTVSLSFHAFETLVREVLAGYVEKGARRIAIISGHAGGAHMEALHQAAQPLVEQEEGLMVLILGPADIPLPFLADAGLSGADGHAGALETSVMLAIDERLVHLDRIPAAERPAFPRGQVLRHSERLFPSGVMGGVSQSSRELGKRVLEKVVTEIARLLPEASRGGAR